jgi:pectate lyase
MKKTLILLVVGAALSCAAQAQVFEDHFNYAAGNLGAVGSSGGWSVSLSQVTVTSNGLDGTSVGLAGSSGNKVTTTTTSNTGTGSYNQFSSGIASGTVYYSFLLRVNSTNGLTSSGQIVTRLVRSGSESSLYQNIWLRSNGANVDVGLSKLSSSTTWHSTPLTVGTVYLVVSKYQFVSGNNNDIVALWLNPATGGTNEPTADISFGSGIGDGSSTGIGRCFIHGGAVADFDEVRVGMAWADVTPSAGTPPPPPTPTPVITNVAITVDGFVISGTNGTPNADYDVLATTNMDLPPEEWPVIATDAFDTNGNFSFVNSVPPDLPQKFYRLRIPTNAPAVVAPTITIQPHDTTNLVGNSASFTVGASGTAPLYYRWYFNSSTPVSNGTSPTLTLLNIQPGDAGGYSAIVSNVAGSVTSVVAQLVVTNVETPPFITTQPQNQTVAVGQTANFSVTAGGSVPLYYQWYFNDVTPLADETNTLLSLSNVTTNDAGGYSVIVSNAFGTTNSVTATLTVNTNAPPDFSPIGFCNNGGTVTGGAAGPTVYVGNASQLAQYADVNPPYTIYITNSFALSGMSSHIRSNKTVIGVGDVVLSGGGLYLYRSGNVIIRNLTIDGSSEDGIGLHYSGNVWIDHCTVKNSSDGGIDITQSSDYITISWCKFIYDADTGHNFVNLIASSDSDNGSQYHTTFHHNWWSTHCVERMPSVRFGRAHVFNNYYNAPGNNYCVRTRIEAELRIENNYFENVQNPWEQYVTISGTQGKAYAANNNIGFLDTTYGVSWTGTTTNKDGTVRVMIPGTDTVFTPSYSYSLDNALDVKDIVINNAGAQTGPFAP